MMFLLLLMAEPCEGRRATETPEKAAPSALKAPINEEDSHSQGTCSGNGFYASDGWTGGGASSLTAHIMSGLTTLTMQVLKMSVLTVAPVMPALTQVLTVPIMRVIQIMTIPIPCRTNSSRGGGAFRDGQGKEIHARGIIAAAGRADMDAIEDSQLIDALSKGFKVGDSRDYQALEGREERQPRRSG